MLIIDYLQLVKGPKSSESRQIEISMISQSLKALAKELNIPVSIGNDASLAALAEKKLSLRIDDENILYMYGDVGAGIITKNDLFWGSTWSAGEIQLNFSDIEDLSLPTMVFPPVLD